MKKIIFAIGILFLHISINKAQETGIRVDSVKKVPYLIMSTKGESNPAVYIDGIQYDAAILGLLDPKKIESVSVLTGEAAEATYDEPKVIIMTSKKSADTNFEIEAGKASEGYNLRDYKGPMLIRQADGGSGKPLIIVDGKVRTDLDLKSIPPDNIQSISVIKDEKAMEKYNTKNGVILITTKKKKK